MSTEGPTRLRIEHSPCSIGVGSARPRLSWWLPPQVARQDAYCVEATVDGGICVAIVHDLKIMRTPSKLLKSVV